jgi:hypothetical protein
LSIASASRDGWCSSWAGAVRTKRGGVSDERRSLADWWAAPAAPYIAAVAVRTAARAAMAAQLALLGAPQTIVRYAGRRLPMRFLVLHSVALAAIAIGAAAAFIPRTRTPTMLGALAAVSLATLGATLFGARAKARFAFGTSLRAELGGAVVLVVAAIVAVAGIGRTVITPGVALMVESIALGATAVVLLRARDSRATTSTSDAAQPSPPVRRMLADIYSVGALVLLDVVLFRRLEVYFLERSPDGLVGVAVLGLSLQIVSIALLVPTALLETWQPRLALAQSSGGDAAFEREFARRGKWFARLMFGVVLLGTAVPLVAVPLVFPRYSPWLGYIVAFVFIRLACAGAGFYSSALYAAGRHRALYAPAVVAVVIAIAGNVVFTRQLGLRGALVAYGATQVTVAVLTIAAFYRASTRVGAGTTPEPAEARIVA